MCQIGCQSILANLGTVQRGGGLGVVGAGPVAACISISYHVGTDRSEALVGPSGNGLTKTFRRPRLIQRLRLPVSRFDPIPRHVRPPRYRGPRTESARPAAELTLLTTINAHAITLMAKYLPNIICLFFRRRFSVLCTSAGGCSGAGARPSCRKNGWHEPGECLTPRNCVSAGVRPLIAITGCSVAGDRISRCPGCESHTTLASCGRLQPSLNADPSDSQHCRLNISSSGPTGGRRVAGCGGASP